MKKYILPILLFIGVTSFICIDPYEVKDINAWKIQVYANGILITANSVIKPKELKTYQVNIVDMATNATTFPAGRFSFELMVIGGKRPMCVENSIDYNSLTDTTIVKFLQKCSYSEGQQFRMKVTDRVQTGSYTYIVYLDKKAVK